MDVLKGRHKFVGRGLSLALIVVHEVCCHCRGDKAEAADTENHDESTNDPAGDCQWASAVADGRHSGKGPPNGVAHGGE